jgi:hypothetical protein
MTNPPASRLFYARSRVSLTISARRLASNVQPTTYDLSRKHVDYGSEIQEALLRWHLGNVGHIHLIRWLSRKILHETIRHNFMVVLRIGAPLTSGTVSPMHQPTEQIPRLFLQDHWPCCRLLQPSSTTILKPGPRRFFFTTCRFVKSFSSAEPLKNLETPLKMFLQASSKPLSCRDCGLYCT